MTCKKHVIERLRIQVLSAILIGRRERRCSQLQIGNYVMEFGDRNSMQKRDFIQANASLENLRQNLEMKEFAKEILLEENYNKFMKSYRFTFWFQLLGILAGFIVPSVILLIAFKDITYCFLGVTIGILWMCIWMPFSLVIPSTRIYRKFAKWYRKRNVSIQDLDEIFYK